MGNQEGGGRKAFGPNCRSNASSIGDDKHKTAKDGDSRIIEQGPSPRNPERPTGPNNMQIRPDMPTSARWGPVLRASGDVPVVHRFPTPSLYTSALAFCMFRGSQFPSVSRSIRHECLQLHSSAGLTGDPWLSNA